MKTVGRVVRFATPKSRRLIDMACRGLVTDAYRNVPLFRQRLDAAGVLPSSIRTAADLASIPVTTSETYLGSARSESLRRGTDRASCRTSQTSGTTGMPLTIYMSRSEAFYRRVLLFRALTRSGRFSFPLTIAEVGAGLIRLGTHRGDFTQRIGLVRVTKIARSLPVEEQARRLLQAAPQVVMGHPSCLELVAEVLQASGGVADHRPRLVVARGEILRPSTRRLLRATFGCPVADHYNCEEVGNVAWECPRTPGVMHVNTDGCVVETVDAEGRALDPGEEGSVVVTNLFNRTMPFIRYRLDDRAALLPRGRCACGHDGASMSLLAGRTGDFLLLSSGRRVSPRTVNSLVVQAGQRDDDIEVSDVRRYQVEQDPAGRVNILVVPREPHAADLGERITGALRGLDPGLDVSVEYMSEIPPEASGKLRIVRSVAQSRTESPYG
ncbi:MAG: hypothetical protein WBC63_06935 [Candidatus Bipolaricaulia bacterium]